MKYRLILERVTFDTINKKWKYVGQIGFCLERPNVGMLDS